MPVPAKPISPNRYSQIIEHVFFAHYQAGDRAVNFARAEIEEAATALGIALPKNVGDLIYSFRYRGALPARVWATAPPGEEWIIRAAGRARYSFVATKLAAILPNPLLIETRLPDATPGLITMYTLGDEQALLAKLRYNRLIDIFTGVTCYSLQNHLRTTVPNLGQVETDEIYVGVDRRGAHYVVPVQAKGGHDTLNIVQIEQDVALCAAKFPRLICEPVAAQFMQADLIALFLFRDTPEGIKMTAERHYRLVPPDELTADELRAYQAPEDSPLP